MIDYPKTKEFLRVYEAIAGRLYAYACLLTEPQSHRVAIFTQISRDMNPFFIEEGDLEIFSKEFERAFDFLNSQVPMVTDELTLLLLNIPSEKYRIIRKNINSDISWHKEGIEDLRYTLDFKQKSVSVRTKNYEIWEKYTYKVINYLQVVEQFYWMDSEITGEYKENPYPYIKIERDRKGNAVGGTTQKLLLFFTYVDSSLLKNENRNIIADWFQISLERFEKTCSDRSNYKSWFGRYCNGVRAWIKQTNNHEVINKFNLDFPQ